MSDFTQEQDHYIPEPDENVLMAALRNQDDIPILMDIVGEQLPPRINQEMHLTQSIHSDATINLKNRSDSEEPSEILPLAEATDPTATLASGAQEASSEAQEVSSGTQQALIQAAIQRAFTRLLPQLVTEVVKELKTLQSETTVK